jgi:hypothetical protein
MKVFCEDEIFGKNSTVKFILKNIQNVKSTLKTIDAATANSLPTTIPYGSIEVKKKSANHSI